MTVEREGGCSCGAIRYVVRDEPFDADYCHCRSCQRHAGAPVGAWFDVRVEQLAWTSRTTFTEYASSDAIRRGFCSRCGATLTYRPVEHPTVISLAIASLDEPSSIRPRYHIHTAEQLDWFDVSDALPRYPRDRRGS